ncbi:MAG TPA: murein biosynthesis integral membrane protein MurJ [Lachnospiraceae bacterium]|nr:murein biosynthesis integral membrane protein MurJ [Lachnospiraceae bacterium]
MSKEKNNAVKAVGSMMMITLLGKLLGLAREQFLAWNYSIGPQANAFSTASLIPRIFFDVVFASAISASFIPVFNEYMQKKGKEEAFKLSSNFITMVGMLSTLLTVFGIIFAPQLTAWFADGFDAQTAALCVNLLRILFPATIFTGLAFSFVGILQSMDEFNIPAAMSIISNAIIIIYYFFLNDRFGIYGLTVAFLIGWAMQAFIQIPALLKRGYKYKPFLDFNDKGLKKIIRLMLPVMVSTWIQPINLAINTKFASRLLDGAGVSAIGYANTVYSIIVGVFVLSVANVIFPQLSRMTMDDDKKRFGETVSITMEVMAFLLIPMTVGMMCLSEPIIMLIYQRGEFTQYATGLTSNALFFFSIGMIGFGIQAILSRAFYAEQNGRIPLLSGIISIGVNVALCKALAPRMGIGGLALASAVSSTVSAIVLFIPMQKRNRIISKTLVIQIIKMIISAGIMAVVVIIGKNTIASAFEPSFMTSLVEVGVPTISGIIVYMVLTRILVVPYAKMVFDYGTKFVKGKIKR